MFKNNLYILVFLFCCCFILNGQVKIEGNITISGNAAMYVNEQDVILEGDIQGEGQLILQKSKDSEARVIVKGKKVSSEEELKLANIQVQSEENLEPTQAASEKEYWVNQSTENTLESLEDLWKLETKAYVKHGSLSLHMVDKAFEPYPFQALFSENMTSNAFVLFDNFIIPDNNYILITKERIMSSQNMHETLLIKSILDPPKKLV